jgi:hypothetical protein
VVGAVVLGAAIFGLAGGFGGLTASGKHGGSDITSAPGKLPDTTLLNASAQVSPPALDRGGEVLQMPPDVYAWLKHLEQIEQRKNQLHGDQVAEMKLFMTTLQVKGAAIGLMDMYAQENDHADDQSPDRYVQGKLADLRPQWQQLVTDFRSFPPPEECRPIAADFDRALSEVPGMVGDINEVLNAVMTDPTSALQKVQKMRNTSRNEIGRYFQRSDQKVAEVCKKYRVNKWFNIVTDIDSGGMLGAFGGF